MKPLNKTEQLLEKSLRKAFIDYQVDISSKHEAKVLFNEPEQKEYVMNTLQQELSTCHDFFFSVAFITQSGLNTIKSYLSDLNDRGVCGRIVTSNYLFFNSPHVFEDLLKIPNLKVRISPKDGFHSKGYLFNHTDYHSLIIGSSNLTMTALKLNYEWNLRLTSLEHGDILQKISKHMEEVWKESIPLTNDWIHQYKKIYKTEKTNQDFSKIEEQPEYIIDTKKPIPNTMQRTALKNLEQLRQTGEKKGLIISATGTGKTYLGAFDVAQFQPEKMLFIVHREQILNKAKESFFDVIGGAPDDFGILSGNSKDIHAKYLFATIQTISKDDYLENFGKNYFDYILIDEVHKAGATTYQKVIDYFEPEFLLGMTATPERTDHFNIFELFDYNIPYEIRLQDAIEENLLCPFHYFGVTDYEYNGEVISETTDLKYLTTDERVKFLLEKINYYGCYKNNPKGLIFCSRKEEARLLCLTFQQHNISCAYLTGEHSVEEREEQISRLEKGEIQYIFTVDVFNEGIDIPMINQVILLRNTQSSIIFLQQLGRGLRKHPSKKFVTVIDFIGNYKNNYMIPMALSGDTSRNKNNLRKDTFDTNFISGLSAINFEKVTKDRIYKAIDSAKLDSIKELKNVFEQLENRLNRVPYLLDFQKSNSLDPLVIIGKFGSYYNFLKKIKKEDGTIGTENDQSFLLVSSRELLPGMRKHELIILNELLHGKEKFSFDELKDFFKQAGILHDNETIESVINTLTLEFFTGMDKKNYEGCPFITRAHTDIHISDKFQKALNNDYFTFLMDDIIQTGLLKNESYDNSKRLTRYQKYSRKNVLRLLGWPIQIVNQNIGGYVHNEHHFPIFVTLKKGDDFKGAEMAYEDELLDESTMRWFTKAPRTMSSPEVIKIKNYENANFSIEIFIKKSDDEGTDFYYLGEVKPVHDSIQQVEKLTQEGKHRSVVEMDLKFFEPLDHLLYEYLTR